MHLPKKTKLDSLELPCLNSAVTVTIIPFSAEKNTDESLFPKYFSEKLFSGMILSSQLRTLAPLQTEYLLS